MPRNGPKKISEEQIKLIVYEYLNNEKTNVSMLAKKYKTTFVVVKYWLKKNGVKIKRNFYLKPKYTVNEDVFNNIDNEYKAYFLGLLYADGYNNETYNSVSLYLQESDKHIIDSFKSFLESDYPIHTQKQHGYGTKNLCGIRLTNKQISKRLAQLGCFARKSLTKRFPTEDQVPKYLLKHFIRGYYDGNGGCTLYKTGKRIQAYMNITSSEYFCEELGKFFIENLNINSQTRSRFPLWSLSKTIIISGLQQTFRLLDWLYKDSTIYLERKYQKFLKIRDRVNYLLTTPRKERIYETSTK